MQASAGPDQPSATAAGIWTISWQRDGLRVLLTMPSEHYVAAALDGEAAGDEPFESLKAMAISIRTFALENANRHAAQGFGLCDSTHCQALRFETPRPAIERAVRETAGETLWFGARHAHIFYTQHCGGRSEAASALWPAEKAPYLAGNREDPYCVRRSSAEWHARIPLAQLSTILMAQGWHTPSPVQEIRVYGHSVGGRAVTLSVTGHGTSATVSASSFRFAVNRALGWNQLRSDWYTTQIAGPFVEFAGRGYGHGIGLCQAGSWQMASEGRNEKQILDFYFPGTVQGITAPGHEWRQVDASGWKLRSVHPSDALVKEGNAAWSKALTLMSSPSVANPPTVEEMPDTELFRQTTNQPGWMLASTDVTPTGSTIYLQPAGLRTHDDKSLLLHEFLHVLVEQQSGPQAPLWLREGWVEVLAGSPVRKEPANVSPAEVDAMLRHSASAEQSRKAHALAAQMADLLRDRFGNAGVRGFLKNGVPAAVAKDLFPAEKGTH